MHMYNHSARTYYTNNSFIKQQKSNLRIPTKSLECELGALTVKIKSVGRTMKTKSKATEAR